MYSKSLDRAKGLRYFFLQTRKYRVIRNLVFSVLILLFLVLGLMAYNLLKLEESFSISLIGQTADYVKNSVNIFIKPVIDNLTLMRKWGEAGFFQTPHFEVIKKSVIPILQQYPDIYAVMIADSTGAGYRVYSDKNNWMICSSVRVKDKIPETLRLFGPDLKEIEQWQGTLSHDPRHTSWYMGAVNIPNNELFMSPVYIFPLSRISVITFSTSYNNKNTPELKHVIGFSVKIANIIRIRKKLKKSTETKVFLPHEMSLTNSGHIPAINRISSETYLADSKDPAAFKAIGKWHTSSMGKMEPFSFRFSGEKWWAAFRPLNMAESNQWIGVALKESDLLEEIEKQRSLYFVIIACSILLIALMILLLIRIYRRATHRVFSSTEPPEKMILELIKKGENDHQEFKATMRWNFKTGKPGKEIEIAWLKTIAAFMNTEGGILLIGVRDNGEICGIDMNGFPNEDKYLLHFNSLIKEYIGLEFSKYMDFGIFQVGGKHVLMVTCRPSIDPVFLKISNHESFFIRSGPASLQLSMSKTLKYLKNRETNQNNK